jgi:sugar lactone lactonase YvrE
MKTGSARLILDCKDGVGESIVWSAAETALYWVDILGSRLHRLEPDSGQHDIWPTPELPTSIGLTADGGFIVGLRRRVTLWRAGGTFDTLAVLEPDLPGNRLNEGVVAPDGSFWVGTMAENIGADGLPMTMSGTTGSLYRITADGIVTRLTADKFGITNTMIWTDDGQFITADTLSNTLYAYRLAQLGATLDIRHAFGSPLARGIPDGSTSDVNGAIYNARVAGGGAIAVLAADGSLTKYLDLPCASPTSCAFGGTHLDRLFVTSARFGMSNADLAMRPTEGGLFELRGLGPGRPTNAFGAALATPRH